MDKEKTSAEAKTEPQQKRFVVVFPTLETKAGS